MKRALPVWPILILLSVTLVLAACSPGTVSTPPAVPTVPPPTPTEDVVPQVSQIVGIWRIYDPHCNPGFMLIRPNGSLTWSCQQDGSSGITGKYHFEGDHFVVLNDFCGAEGEYEIHAAGSGPTGKGLIFKVIKDDCAAEVDAFTNQDVTWFSALP